MKRWKRNGLGVIAAGLGLVLGVVPASAEPLAVPDNGPVAGGTSVTLPKLPDARVEFTSVAGGYFHSLAVGADGNVYGWGTNTSGQLGNGSTTAANVPTIAMTPSGVTFTAVAGGNGQSLAVGSDGNTYAWGHNAFGQLGNGNNTQTDVPTRVETPAGVTFTAVYAGESHSLAVGSDGNAYAWGRNVEGQLGNGSTMLTSYVPTLVETPSGVTFTAVDTGQEHSLAVGSDGNTYAWGRNYFGELGNGSTNTKHVPTLVETPAGVSFTAVSAGYGHSLAVGSDGNIYGWGRNSSGQLGNGSTNTRTLVPTLVDAPAGVTFVSVVAGGYHSLAVGSDGNTYGWGSNYNGELGNGNTTIATMPTLVDTPAGVSFTAVAAAGVAHSFAFGSDGNTYAWGHNGYGQLGNNESGLDQNPFPGVVKLPTLPTELTRVLFDGVPAADAVVNEDGTITITTPESPECGPVDVTVEWTAAGVVQDPIVYEGGFTFEGEFALTAPRDQTVKAGTDASFATGWTVCHGGAPVWEVSLDDGKTWVEASTLPGVTVSDEGLTVTASGEVHGALVRATGRDGDDAVVVSDAAVLALAPSTVTFDSKGGSAVEAVTVPYGDLAAAPKDPTRAGHRFTGWYTDAAGTAKYNFSGGVTDDVTLYAGWEKIAPAPTTPGALTKPGNGGLAEAGGGGLSALLVSGLGLAATGGLLLARKRRITQS